MHAMIQVSAEERGPWFTPRPHVAARSRSAESRHEDYHSSTIRLAKGKGRDVVNRNKEQEKLAQERQRRMRVRIGKQLVPRRAVRDAAATHGVDTQAGIAPTGRHTTDTEVCREFTPSCLSDICHSPKFP